TRSIFTGALGVDLLLVFALLYLTGGGDSPFVNLFFPLVAVNPYYFGRWTGLLLTLVGPGLLYWGAAKLAPPEARWTAAVTLLGDIVGEGPGPEMEDAGSLVGAIREQVAALDALTEEYLAFARFPRAQFEEDSVNDMVRAVVDFVRPLAARQEIGVIVTTDPA